MQVGRKKALWIAIFWTVVLVGIFPFSIYLPFILIMTIASPSIPMVIAVISFSSWFMIPFFVPFTVGLIWANFSFQAYKNIGRCMLIPLGVFCFCVLINGILSAIAPILVQK